LLQFFENQKAIGITPGIVLALPGQESVEITQAIKVGVIIVKARQRPNGKKNMDDFMKALENMKQVCVLL
jgi:hypothetical protein